MLIGTNWGREKEKESGRERWEEGKKERERERERKKRENRTFFKLPSKTRISINIIINCYWIRWLFAPWHWHIKLIILWRPLRYDRWCNERVDETSFCFSLFKTSRKIYLRVNSGERKNDRKFVHRKIVETWKGLKKYDTCFNCNTRFHARWWSGIQLPWKIWCGLTSMLEYNMSIHCCWAWASYHTQVVPSN